MKNNEIFQKLKQVYGNVGLQVRKCKVDSSFNEICIY